MKKIELKKDKNQFKIGETLNVLISGDIFGYDTLFIRVKEEYGSGYQAPLWEVVNKNVGKVPLYKAIRLQQWFNFHFVAGNHDDYFLTQREFITTITVVDSKEEGFVKTASVTKEYWN